VRGQRPLGHLVSTLLLISAATSTDADIIAVGPDEAIRHISDAARLARDGDIVLIKAGTYRGDVAVWQQKKLEIRGVGGRPVLVADGMHAEGKAIWVFRDGEFEVDNIEFRGTRVPDGNGAGIRFERGRLTVRNCVFDDNQNGLLTANFEDTELHIHDSVFSNAPRNGNQLAHLLYVGRIGQVTIEGSRFHNGFEGHLIKSRAKRSDIRYNLIVDGPGGEASYEIDLPNGGDALLVGNVIGQSASSQNPVMVAYGAEGPIWPGSRLRMAHNTLIHTGWRPAWFVRAWPDKLPPDTPIITRNNLHAGLGIFTTTLPGDHAGNVALPASLLSPDILDFTGPFGSISRKFSVALEGTPEEDLRPTAAFAFPVGTSPRAPSTSPMPGAFEHNGLTH